MRYLITKLIPIEGDPEFPKMDVVVEGNHENVHLFMHNMKFTGLVKNGVSQPIDLINLQTTFQISEIHLLIDGKDVTKLEVGDYLERLSKVML